MLAIAVTAAIPRYAVFFTSLNRLSTPDKRLSTSLIAARFPSMLCPFPLNMSPVEQTLPPSILTDCFALLPNTTESPDTVVVVLPPSCDTAVVPVRLFVSFIAAAFVAISAVTGHRPKNDVEYPTRRIVPLPASPKTSREKRRPSRSSLNVRHSSRQR